MALNDLVSRRAMLSVLGVAALRAQGQAGGRPNVVLILADDLGYGDLGAWGGADLRTPHIDALAASGVRFDRFYANSPVCSPTRAALLSGCYPDTVGVPGVIRTAAENSWGYLAAHAQLLPARLRGAGYHSALVGNWHLGLDAPNLPNLRGFDHFHGFLGDMMDDYYTHRRHERNYMRLNAEHRSQGSRYRFVQRLGDGVFEFAQGAGSAVLPVSGVQRSARAGAASSGVVGESETARARNQREARQIGGAGGTHGLGRGACDGGAEGNGQLANTLVIFVSDNGGELAMGASCGALRGGKGQMYEGGIRVPMCMSWPGRLSAGTRNVRVGLTMDLYATVCEAAGVTASGVDGVSLLGETKARDLVWVRREGGLQYAGREFYAFRRGDWKLLQNTAFQPYELYNLANDPEEKRDLAKAEPKVYKELVEALMLHVQRAGRTAWQG